MEGCMTERKRCEEGASERRGGGVKRGGSVKKRELIYTVPFIQMLYTETV
jgi:hypothetical protein